MIFVRRCSGCLMEVEILHLMCSLQLLFFEFDQTKRSIFLGPICFIGYSAIASNSAQWGIFILDWSRNVSLTVTRVAMISVWIDGHYHGGDGNRKDTRTTETQHSMLCQEERRCVGFVPKLLCRCWGGGNDMVAQHVPSTSSLLGLLALALYAHFSGHFIRLSLVCLKL